MSEEIKALVSKFFELLVRDERPPEELMEQVSFTMCPVYRP
jgi:hypothetical protein